MPTESPGWRQIGHYRVLEEIGRGGQGVVFRAKDLTLGREVAIKTLRRTSLSSQELERFKREARIASRLDHPGICPVYEVGDHEGEPYLVMRYVRGITLAEKLSELRMSPTSAFTFVDVLDSSVSDGEEATTRQTAEESVQARALPSGDSLQLVLRLIEQVARALHEAHEADVIHRDVKPGNVIVTSDGQPVLVDFGVATMLRDDTPTVTKTGQTPGTPQYMSPEQTSGRHFELDRRTDIYSLGVTLYECLTLRLPFKDDTDVPRQIMFAPVPDPRAMNHAISKDLKTVIETALEKDRERRYRTAADFADDLRCVREHKPIKARPVGTFMRVARWSQRNPVVAASLVSTFIILATALVVTWSLFRDAQAARDSERTQREELDRARSLYEPLADLKRVQDLAPWSFRLWPSVGANIGGPDGMDAWLIEAKSLVAKQPWHENLLRSLQAGGADMPDADRARRIRVLQELIPELAMLPGRMLGMKRRRESATTLEWRTIGQFRQQWDSIARELAADPRFAAISPLKPQLGLVPIGKNAAGLFEFALADSGEVPGGPGESRPFEIKEETAAILVLMPAGTLEFDPTPRLSQPPPTDGLVKVTITPFLLGTHEVTQAQWLRRMESNRSVVQRGFRDVTPPINERHPVENMTWTQAVEFCRRLGVRLPTQDEWEYGARGKKGGEWGDAETIDDLDGRENFADIAFLEKMAPVANPAGWFDKYAYHSPVGSFIPNSFGLYDILGNVAEHVSDFYSYPRRPSDGLGTTSAASRDASEPRRVYRGGSWSEGLSFASCRAFRVNDPGAFQPKIGLRIARSVDR